MSFSTQYLIERMNPLNRLKKKFAYLKACSRSSPELNILRLNTHYFMIGELTTPTYSGMPSPNLPSVAAIVFASALLSF
jgi:hypothetical protein